VKLRNKQINNRRIWLMVLKILQPSSNRKKEGIEGSRVVEEKIIVGSGISI
jgi:hypothetical protein